MKFRIWVQYGIATMSSDFDVAGVTDQKGAEQFAEALLQTWNAQEARVKKDPLIGVLLRVELLGESLSHRWVVLSTFTSSSGAEGELLSCTRCKITGKRLKGADIKRDGRFRAKRYEVCPPREAA